MRSILHVDMDGTAYAYVEKESDYHVNERSRSKEFKRRNVCSLSDNCVLNPGEYVVFEILTDLARRKRCTK